MKYILFDLDGTLVDTSEGIINSIKRVLLETGLEYVSDELKCFIGPPLNKMFEEHFGVNEEEANQLTGLFRTYYNEDGKYICKLYEGIKALLVSLKREGYALFVATSKPTVFAKDILEYLGIADFFDEVVGSNLDNTRSDKTEIIQYILRKYLLDERLGEVVMIGDRAQDLIGAAECGILGIGVTYGFGCYEELVAQRHEAIFESTLELENYFTKEIKND